MKTTTLKNKTSLKTNFKEILKAKKLKATPARLAVLDLFASMHEPLAIHDILDSLKKTKMDQATAYRMMEDFKKVGLIREINLEHGHAHFELESPTHHHHAICENCGKVIDLGDCDVASLEKQAKQKSGFSIINRHSLEFFGICNSCSKLSK